MSASANAPSQTRGASVFPHTFAELFEREGGHFWFRSRNRLLERLVRQLIAGQSAGYRVLEVGCGTGFVLQMLESVCEQGEVTGLELHEEGLRYARQRVQCNLIAADIRDMRFEAPFDLIGMFDVLEHLPDDRAILEIVRRNLSKGGNLLLTVPAHQSLWSYADDFAEHYRRYSTASLRATLEAAGFKVEFISQFMAVLYPLMWLGRRLNGWSKKTQSTRSFEETTELMQRELRVPTLINLLLYGLLAWESAWISRRWRLPIGTSLLAIATPA